jgi:ribosomal protein L32
MLNKDKYIRPDIEGEMEEIQRFSQELSRDEDIEVSVDEVIKSLKKSEEQLLTNDIWNVLENTESNEIELGDWKTVNRIARGYKKTSPKILKKAIESGEYKRPLIAELDGRYILMAGNTRLCTAAAMGINPKVFIADINVDSELNEKWSEKYKKSIDCNNPKGFSQRAHCQGRKKETKESMGADSAGAFEGPAFGGVIKKKDLYKPNNFKKYNVNEVVDSSSVGAYDAPFGDGGKNPLKINGEKSIKKSRAVKDKNFPKWGGPGSIFIKIKEKCKKYPYCNQGDINAIELLEIEKDIQEVSEKYGIPYKEMEKVVLNEINKIFINMNLSDLNNLIESIASEEIKKTIISESEDNKKQVYHIKLNGEPVETFNSKEEAEEALPKYQEKDKGELIIEPEIYESYEDMIEKMDQMGQELEEKENQNMENQEPMEGNAFAYAALKAKEAGDETFEFDGETHNVEESWKQLEEEEGMCEQCGDNSMEEELTGNQDKIDTNKNGKIDAGDFEKLRDMKEGKNVCEQCGSMLNEEGMCNECGTMKESTKKKRVLRLTESQMMEMIKKIVAESVPGQTVTKIAQTQSKKDNEANAKEVGEKIKKATTIPNSDNPEFPHQNNSGTKVARQNNEEENEFVEDNRGGSAIDLDYDHEPSDKFKERLKDALEGSTKMGNSQDAANVVKSDLGKKLVKQAERKKKKEDGAPMYNKDAQPVKEVNETKNEVSSVLKEEIEKIKKMASYNKKTQ